MIPEPGDANREVTVTETFHVQTDDELSDKELKQIEADDQAIQTILLGLLEDIYAAVDSCETAQEIWLRVQQMMKGSDIGIQEKKAKLFNEWERFTSNEGESIESYYHCFLKLMNDLKRNKHFLEKIATRAEGNAARQNGNQIRCYNCRGKEEARIQLQAKEYDLMAAATNIDEIEEVNANCILIANLQQASTSGTQTDRALVYDSDGSAEIDNNVISKDTSVEQGRETVEQHPANFEETRALYESLYQNLAIKVEKVNSVNRKLKEINADLTTELARFKNQTRCFEISQEKYDKLERCYQQSVYQEQCLSKKINALHLSTEKKKLKSDFKTREDELFDKHIQLEKKIKELNNILVKTGQSIQMIHMLTPKLDSFYHTEQRMALGYQNSFYLKQAQKKQQSLYDGKVLLEKHDPPVVHESEETLQLAQESREKMKQLNKEIKPANYTKINHLSGVFVPQTAMSLEELYFSNNSKMANVSKSISIPNKDFSNDTTPSVARKFLNEYTELLEPIPESHQAPQNDNDVISEDTSMEQGGEIVEQHPVNFKETCALYESLYHNLAIEVEKVNSVNRKLKETNADLTTELASNIYKNAKLRTQLFKKVSVQKDNTLVTSENTKFAKQPIVENLPKVGESHALSKLVTSNSVSTQQESKGVNNDKVITPRMFRINPDKTSREEKKHVPNIVRASDKKKPITVSQPPVFTMTDVNSDLNGLSSTGVDNTKTRRPQPRSNIKNDRNVDSKVVCAMCKQCLISVNHDDCLLNYVYDKNSRGKKQKENVTIKEKQKKRNPKVIQICLWCVDSGCSKHMIGNLKLLINFVWKFLETVRFGNDHVAAILGFDDLQWGNILITRVYFIEELGHNLFSVGQFCDSDLEVAFRRNACFVRNLERVDLLKGYCSTNLYTISLHEMASTSPICLMARASSTKSWLWHQRLSHLNFDTVNDLARNDLVSGLPKFKYHKEHLCPSYTFKSTSGGAQFLGEKLVSWSSKKQDCMALSTAKAEYVSLSACCA
nr:retrovirus-related Pol polyprotein from transposon TNT 1-94 [Tanacetum cinerariifolium]